MTVALKKKLVAEILRQFDASVATLKETMYDSDGLRDWAWESESVDAFFASPHAKEMVDVFHSVAYNELVCLLHRIVLIMNDDVESLDPGAERQPLGIRIVSAEGQDVGHDLLDAVMLQMIKTKRIAS